MRVARRAIVAIFGGEAVGVGVHIEHPAEQGAGAVQLAHRPAVAGCRRPIAQQFGAGEGGVPGDIKQIFHCVRNPCQRRQGALFAAQGIDALGFGEHACFRHGGPGIDLRVNARNCLQRLAGYLLGAQLARAQRMLDRADTHLV